MMERDEKLEFIKTRDPEGMERLKRLLDRKAFLLDRNVYGERFTERQFDLIFEPLLSAAYERARILDLLAEKEMTVRDLNERMLLDDYIVFNFVKDLLKKNQVEIVRFDERHPVFRRK
jgi:DNA-binding transcriptional ArsR family regulator